MTEKIKGALFGLMICTIISLILGCKSVRYVPVDRVQKDSVTTVVRTQTIYEKDTAYIKIPEQKAERVQPDTLESCLENDLSISKAWITPDGLLHHTLETKPQDMPFEYDKKVEKQDSSSYVSNYKQDKEPYPVERELTTGEKVKMNIGEWAIALVILTILIVVGYIIYKFKK